MRVGVIGAGGHASSNLYPNLQAAGLKLVATCARHQNRAERAAATWGARLSFDNAENMLNEVELDGVIVCVKASDYPPLVEMCLKAGIPVFCDKPGAPTSAEGFRLAALATSTGVPVVVGYMKRFAPSYVRARGIAESKDFGRPSLGVFTFMMGQGFEGDLRTYLIDNPVHHLDLARNLLGELGDLQAQVTELPGFGHAVAAMARASSGAVCTFNLGTVGSWQQRNEYVELFGEGHSVWIDNVDICTYRPQQGPEQVWRPNYTVPIHANSGPTIMGFVPELEHFRQVVTNNAKNQSDMASAAATLALAERLCDIAGV